MDILHKGKTALKTIRVFKNWYQVLLSYLGFIKNTEFIYYLRNGFKFRMYANRNYYHPGPILEIWLDKFYTPCGDEIQEGYTVVDIGAHVGTFSIFAASRADNIIVFSYEPEPHNFAFLQDNIRLNKLNNISLFQMAVAGKDGKGKLYISTESVDHSLCPLKDGQTGIDVDCITLDRIIGIVGKCDFLKMDCEGAEYDVLFNTSRQNLSKINCIAMECHDLPALISNGYDSDNLKLYLEEAGFKVNTVRIPGMRDCYLYARK